MRRPRRGRVLTDQGRHVLAAALIIAAAIAIAAFARASF